MKMNARKIVEWVRVSIRSLSLNPEFGSLDAVYNNLAASSGLSKSLIMKLYSGESMNPTVDTLDKLVVSVKEALRKTAA